MAFGIRPKGYGCHLRTGNIDWPAGILFAGTPTPWDYQSKGRGESPLKTTMIPTFKVLVIILLAISITVLSLVVLHEAQTLLASVGWHGMASVGWHGMASVSWSG
jgi:hypothetical protein